MCRTRQLTESVQELIRWRWSQKPTLKSLADEYGVSQSCISDILNPKLRLRRRRKYVEGKKAEQEARVEGSTAQHFTRQGKVVNWKG